MSWNNRLFGASFSCLLRVHGALQHPRSQQNHQSPSIAFKDLHSVSNLRCMAGFVFDANRLQHHLSSFKLRITWPWLKFRCFSATLHSFYTQLTLFFTIRPHAHEVQTAMTMTGQVTTSTHQNGSSGRSNRGSRPLVCFFSIPIFYLLTFFIYLHLELPQWRWMASPPGQHIKMAATAAVTMAAVGARDVDASGKSILLFFAQLTFVSFVYN